jgi:hypothetical protein
MPRAWILILSLLFSATACDVDAPVGASPGNGDPGTGTGTLLVVARVTAEASDNADDPTRFETELSVRVTRSGSPVEGATVRVGTSAGSTSLAPSEPGSYTASQQGYQRSYTLEVQAGADSLSGAQLEGPAAHSFTSPTAGTVHPAGQALDVRWTPAGAEQANIETEELPSTTINDSGAYTVAGTYLAGGAGEEEDRVLVTRANQLDLAGGAPGSSLVVSVRNGVEISVHNP